MVGSPREKRHKAGPADGQMWDLLLSNCRVATMVCAPGGSPYGALSEGSADCAIGVSDGKIAWIGKQDELKDSHGGSAGLATNVFDVAGGWVTPGLIECHSHIVYGGNRSGEWELKLKGATYEEVAKAGGGIVNTVDGTRKASVDDLVRMAQPRVQALLNEGVTAIDIKSGYGLSLESERKMLQAGKELARLNNFAVTKTYLGAHAIPREYAGRADDYITTVVSDLAVLHSEGLVDCVDAFCETIGFSVAQTSRVFDKATELKVPVRLHGDQLHDFGGAALAAKYSALSCDHCEYTSEEGAARMAEAGTVAVLLPSSNYFIKEKQKPPVAAFRKNGVPMAIGTNSNPGSSPCCSILLNLNMACTMFGFTPEEALLGVTKHAAKAMGHDHLRGTLEAGKVADIAIWDVESPCELAYHLGLNRLKRCYRSGKLSVDRSSV